MFQRPARFYLLLPSGSASSGGLHVTPLSMGKDITDAPSPRQDLCTTPNESSSLAATHLSPLSYPLCLPSQPLPWPLSQCSAPALKYPVSTVSVLALLVASRSELAKKNVYARVTMGSRLRGRWSVEGTWFSNAAFSTAPRLHRTSPPNQDVDRLSRRSQGEGGRGGERGEKTEERAWHEG